MESTSNRSRCAVAPSRKITAKERTAENLSLLVFYSKMVGNSKTGIGLTNFMRIIKSNLPLQGNSSSGHMNFLCLVGSVTHVFAYPVEMKNISVKLRKEHQQHVSRLLEMLITNMFANQIKRFS